MNYIAGFLLIVSGGNEEEAFWTFVYLSKDPKFQLLGLFEDNFPLVYFLLYIFWDLLKKHDKKLFNHI